MADRTPLRIATVAGVPIIAEFQPEDAVAITAGGTGASSISDFKTNIGLTDLEASVGNIDTSVGDISGYISDNEGTWSAGGAGSVTALEADVTALQADVTSIDASVGDISGYISDNEATWAAGGGGGVSLTSFEGLQADVTALEADVTALQADVTSVEASVGTNAGDINTLDNSISLAEGRITTLENDTTGVDFGEVGALTAIGLTGVDLTSVSLTSLDADVTALQGDVTSLQANDVSLTSFTDLDSRVTDNDNDLTAVNADLTSLQADVTALQQVDLGDVSLTSFTDLDGRVTSNDNDLTAVNADLTSLDARATSLESDDVSLTSFTDLDGRVTSNDNDLTAVNADLTSLDARATSLESNDVSLTSFTNLDSRVTSNDNDLTAVNADLTSLDARVTSNDNDLTAVNADLTSLDTRISSNDSDIVTLDNRADALETKQVKLPHNTSGVVFCSGSDSFGVGGQPTANNQRLAWNTTTGKPEWGLLGGAVGTNGYILESDGAGGESWVPKSALDDLAPAPGGSNEFILWTGSEYTSYNLTSIHHGALDGLEDNDHPHYELTSVNLTLSDLVTSHSNDLTAVDADLTALQADVTALQADVTALEAGGGGGGVTDHGALTGLTDDDHPQYTLTSVNLTLSDLVTSHSNDLTSLDARITSNDNDLTAVNADLTSIDARVTTNAGNISTNTGNISTNTTNITSNSNDVTALQADVTALQADVTALEAGGGGGGVTDHGALTGLADDDHTQYARVDGTRNLQTQTISDTYTGTIGDTSIGYGIETAGNLINKAGSYMLFSATTGYQFRDPTVTYTNTSFPTTLDRRLEPAIAVIYNTQQATQDLDAAATGNHPTFNQTAIENNTAIVESTDSTSITVKEAGIYEIEASVYFSTTTVRYNGELSFEMNGTQIAYGRAAHAYIRASSGHNEASLNLRIIYEVSSAEVSAGGKLACRIDRLAATGSDVDNEPGGHFSVRRIG